MKRQGFGKSYERTVSGNYTVVATVEAQFPVKAIYKNATAQVLEEKAWDSHGNLIMHLDYTQSSEIVDVVVATKEVVIDKLQNPNSNLPAELEA